MFDLKKSIRQRCDGLDPKHGKKMCRVGTAGIERSCSFTVLSSALPMVRLFVPGCKERLAKPSRTASLNSLYVLYTFR